MAVLEYVFFPDFAPFSTPSGLFQLLILIPFQVQISFIIFLIVFLIIFLSFSSSRLWLHGCSKNDAAHTGNAHDPE